MSREWPTIIILIASYVEQAQAQTLQECAAGFQSLNYMPQSTDRQLMGIYYNNDSYVQLAQAGKYYGPSGISEYVGYVGIENPYTQESQRNVTFHFQRTLFNATSNECSFFATFISKNTYGNLGKWDGMAISASGMVRATYSAALNKITRWYVFYRPPAIRGNLGLLANAPEVIESICQTMKDMCPQVWQQQLFINGTSTEECKQRMWSLPDFTDGSLNYFDGNSRACRTLHGLFVPNNTDHCPHISFVPIADVNGKIKCQQSEQVNPDSFFSAGDFQILETFDAANNIDSELGFKMILASPCQSDDDCPQLFVCNCGACDNATVQCEGSMSESTTPVPPVEENFVSVAATLWKFGHLSIWGVVLAAHSLRYEPDSEAGWP